MLVIGRKKGQKIKIGNNITLHILEAHHQVRIGIEAPLNIPVHREEIYKKIQREEALSAINMS